MTTPAWKPMVFALNAQQHPITAAGKPITCDGCSATLTTQPTADQQRPVPADIAQANYGQPYGALTYIVCGRGEACFDLAAVAEELYQVVRCTTPGCNGARCRP